MADDNTNPARDLASLWGDNERRFKPSRDLITECSEWSLMHRPPALPSVDGRVQGVAVQLPHAATMPHDVASFVARRQPSIKRTPLGSGSRAARTASDVETWLQEAFKSKIKIDGLMLWDVLCAHGTADAEYAVIVQPAPSHYSGLLELLDDDGTIRAEWHRNKDGLDPDEYLTKTGGKSGYSVSKKRSREAQQSYARDYKARRWPFVVRVLSAAEYLPLGRDPLTGRLDTLLVRSVCSASHLKTQGFNWYTHSTGGADESNVDGSGQTYWLYELHSSNPWTITYQIVGMEGQRYESRLGDTPAQKGLNMAEEFGLSSLPAGVFYGWCRPHDKDPATRGIPLLAPFRGIMGAANRSLAGITEHSYRTGYGGWAVELNPNLVDAWVELGRPTHFDLHDDSIHTLLGHPTSLVHGGVGQDAWRILEFLNGLVERFNESERVRTSPDNSSIAQTTSLASADTILSQITNGALQAYQLVAESLLEQCAALSEKTGGPIPVYTHVNSDGEEQTHVELTAKDMLGDFTVVVDQPTKKGSNLAKAQAGVSWQQQGLIGRSEWREDFYGDEQPQQALDQIAAEEYLYGDEGKKQLQALVARIQGDREALKLRGLQDAGQMTMGGTPSAALPPGGPGQAAPPANGVMPNGVPAATQPNPAASSLGGQMAAAINPGAVSNVVTATGTGPELSTP